MRVDADLVAGGQAEPLADEVLDACVISVSASQHHAVRRALVHGAEDDEVGALGVGLDQLQLVAGHTDVGVAGGQHLGDGRACSGRRGRTRTSTPAVGEEAVGVGEVPRRPLDVGHPVERGAHGARRVGGRRCRRCSRPAPCRPRPSWRRRRRSSPTGVVIVVAAARGRAAVARGGRRRRGAGRTGEERCGGLCMDGLAFSGARVTVGSDGGQVQRRWTARSSGAGGGEHDDGHDDDDDRGAERPRQLELAVGAGELDAEPVGRRSGSRRRRRR